MTEQYSPAWVGSLHDRIAALEAENERLANLAAQVAAERDEARREVERRTEALRLVYGYAAAIQRMTAFARIGFRCSLIREAVSRALPDDEAKRLHDETEIILDTLTEDRPPGE